MNHHLFKKVGLMKNILWGLLLVSSMSVFAKNDSHNLSINKGQFKKLNSINFSFPMPNETCEEGEIEVSNVIINALPEMKESLNDYFSIQSEIKSIGKPGLFFNDFHCSITIESKTSLFSFEGISTEDLEKVDNKKREKLLKINKKLVLESSNGVTRKIISLPHHAPKLEMREFILVIK